MHTSVMEFVGRAVQERELHHATVLDVGSLDVNGSARPLFSGPYYGIDIQDGPGVDEVANIHDCGPLVAEYDVIVCCEMLEHDDLPWVSLGRMRACVRDNGLFAPN